MKSGRTKKYKYSHTLSIKALVPLWLHPYCDIRNNIIPWLVPSSMSVSFEIMLQEVISPIFLEPIEEVGDLYLDVADAYCETGGQRRSCYKTFYLFQHTIVITIVMCTCIHV